MYLQTGSYYILYLYLHIGARCSYNEGHIMGATEFYEKMGITPEELYKGESVEHYAMRVFAQQNDQSVRTGVLYSYSTVSPIEQTNQQSHQLYTY